MIVIVEKNKEGKIEITEEELKKLLEDAKNEGYAQANTHQVPYWQPGVKEIGVTFDSCKSTKTLDSNFSSNINNFIK